MQSRDTTTDDIIIFYTNANGLLNKMEELKIAASVYGAKILLITETHLDVMILDSEVMLENFNLFRTDRKNGKKCGGSCVFVHKSIYAEPVREFDGPDSVAVTVTLNNKIINLICIYRSQNLTNLEQDNLLQNLQLGLSNDVIVAGDFNFPQANWDSFTSNTNDKLQKLYL